MSLRRQAAHPDRRQADGLRFDPLVGRLELGIHVRNLPPGAGNREVLDAYVELTAWCRGERVADVVDVRQADIEALAVALDLDAHDLGDLVQQTLGTTPADAQRLIARLREMRLIGGITKAALGGVVAGALVTGCGTSGGGTGASVTKRPPTPTVTTTTAPTAPAGEAGPSEVRLVPPETVDAEPIGLIPPVTADQPG
jgi:hypothetical protein